MDREDIERIATRLKKEILPPIVVEMLSRRQEFGEYDLETFCNSTSEYIETARARFMEMLEERKDFTTLDLALRITFLSNVASAINIALGVGHPHIMGLAKLQDVSRTIIACLIRDRVSARFRFLPPHAVPLFYCESFQELQNDNIQAAKLFLNPDHIADIIH